MEYDKNMSRDYMKLHQRVTAELRDMLPAKTMESFATNDIPAFHLSAAAMLGLLDVIESEPRSTFNLAALGFQPITGRKLRFKDSKSVELSKPRDALVLPIRELRSSEKTRLMAMTSYSTARNALITGISGTFAFKSAITLEADRFQNLEKSGMATLFLVGTLGVMYLAGKQVVNNIPQIIASTKARQIGVAIGVPNQLDMSYPQIAQSLSKSYAFVY